MRPIGAAYSAAHAVDGRSRWSTGLVAAGHGDEGPGGGGQRGGPADQRDRAGARSGPAGRCGRRPAGPAGPRPRAARPVRRPAAPAAGSRCGARPRPRSASRHPRRGSRRRSGASGCRPARRSCRAPDSAECGTGSPLWEVPVGAADEDERLLLEGQDVDAAVRRRRRTRRPDPARRRPGRTLSMTSSGVNAAAASIGDARISGGRSVGSACSSGSMPGEGMVTSSTRAPAQALRGFHGGPGGAQVAQHLAGRFDQLAAGAC